MTTEATKNIYEKMALMRVALQGRNIKKSGENKFANFDYFTLEDILPTLNNLMLDYKVFSDFSIDGDMATLTFINIENTQEKVVFTSPIAEAQIKGSTPVQCLGGVHTYLKRYLYLNAFEIVEADILDALAGSDKLEAKGNYKPQGKAPKLPPVQKQMVAPIKEEKKPEVVEQPSILPMITYEQAIEMKIPSGKKLGELEEKNIVYLMENEKHNVPADIQMAAQVVYEHDFLPF